MGYRDWVGVVIGEAPSNDPRRAPAAVVTMAFRRLRRAARSHAQLLASGFAVKPGQAKVFSFVESQMPVRLMSAAVDEVVVRDFESFIRELVLGAWAAEAILSDEVRTALWTREHPKPDRGALALARDRFWDETEAPFHELVGSLADALEAHADDEEMVRDLLPRARKTWHATLRRAALDIFDALVPLDRLEDRQFERVERGQSRPGGPIAARRNLLSGLAGYGPAGVAFFKALGLQPPEPAAKRKGSKAA